MVEIFHGQLVLVLGLGGSDLNCKLAFLKDEPCVLIPTTCCGFNKLTLFIFAYRVHCRPSAISITRK